MNLISSDDLTKADIKRLFAIAARVSSDRSDLSLRENATVALLFTEPSTRTRVSFEVAVAQLGGMPIYIDAKNTQLSRGEEITDTARMLSMLLRLHSGPHRGPQRWWSRWRRTRPCP